jgi:hypothetical protein
MEKREFWNKAKGFFKIGLEELLKSIKLIPVYILAVLILLIILKYMPDFLIANFKPSLLDSDQTVTYFCTIIASFVTIGGVFFTLWHNRKMFKDQLKENAEKFEDERRLSVLPYMTLNKIGMEEYIAKRTLETEAEEAVKKNYKEQEYYSDYSSLLGFYKLTEYPIDEIYVYFTNEKIKFVTHLDKADRDIIQSGPQFVNNEKHYSYFYKPYSLANSGIGTAVGLRIYLYKMKKFDDGNMNAYGIPSMSPIINLSSGQSCKFSFYSNDITNMGEYYRLRLEYSDIVNGKIKCTVFRH